WEMGRQLAGISGNGINASFKYNSEGIRTEKTVGTVTTKYHLVGDKVTFESNGTDTIYYSYDSSDNLISMKLNGVEYYYIRNAQGDIIGLLDGTGTQVVSYTYDSWGKLISIEGSLKDSVGVKNPYRYRGYRYDEETQLYYLQSRYYNPEFCRMLNADDTDILTQQHELLGKNLFAYCTNDPINHSDDDGFWKLPNWAKVTIGVVAIGVAVAAAVATGGAAVPALATAAKLAASSAILSGGIGAVSGYVSGGRKGALRGAIDGAADGFMWGGAGALASKGGYGWKLGKNLQVLYRQPSNKGGALFALKKPKVRVEMDMLHGFHAHWGKGKAQQKLHKSINPFRWGTPKKGFWR
ncbi:hypothetical protein Q428_12455, partial [Fervidicella metallireducens AeB]